MKAKIVNQTNEKTIIEYSDNSLGHGQLTITWDYILNKFILK